MAATSVRPDALTAAYQAQVRAVRARVVAFVGATWLGLGTWRDSDVDRFVTLVLPVVLGGQMSVSALTNAYLARYRQMVFGGPFRAVSIDPKAVTGAAARNGTDPAVVYHRAGKQLWRALSNGEPIAEAVKQGHDRAVEAAATDLQRSKLLTDRAVARRDPERTGTRRVLEGAYSCGLCVLAATQRYSKLDLLPLHPACDCSAEPLYGVHKDQVLEPEMLEELHRRAEAFFGLQPGQGRGVTAGSHGEHREIDYRDIVVIHEHGELGPVLARRGQAFTGPNDI